MNCEAAGEQLTVTQSKAGTSFTSVAKPTSVLHSLRFDASRLTQQWTLVLFPRSVVLIYCKYGLPVVMLVTGFSYTIAHHICHGVDCLA